MSAIGTALYKFLANAIGGVDWKQGSVVRELVAEPIVGLSDAAAGVINAEYAKLNISALLEDPATHSADIDDLFNELGLSAPTPTQSTGVVRVLTTSYSDQVLAAGTSFYYDTIILSTDRQFKLTLIPQDINDIQLTQIGSDAYEALVPVTSTVTGVSLRAGAILNWSGLGNDIYEATVASAVTGGIGAYTAVQKINLIQQRMFPIGLTCAEGVLRGLNYLAPASVVDCKFATQSTGGRVTLFVKTTAAPERWTVTAIPRQINESTQRVVIDAVGFDHIVSINGIAGDSAAVMIQKQPRQWTIEYPGTATTAEIAVYGLKTLTALQTQLDDFTQGTGLVFDLSVPTLLDASIMIPIAEGELPATVVDNIVQSINGTELDTSLVGDILVRPIISDAGLTMNGTGTYTLRRVFPEGVTSAQTTCDPTALMMSGRPCAVYGYNNEVALING